ncbi:RNaseH domain-containing protein [Nonomuraea sp. bgisy101]|uniref:RNaseH domain-containing protein n=1 Tax=Nonomuraea sp. bgisy101 TaxID=3413784 RepID=UPI003D715DD4
MPESMSRLNVLAFRFTPDLAGTVQIRRLPEEFQRAWWAFDSAYKATCGKDVQPAHSAISLALRGLLGGHVHFDPGKGELVTEMDLDDQDILDAFTLFRAFSLEEEPDLGRPCDLAKIVAATPAECVHLGTFLDGGCTQPNPPGWVFATAGWAFARSLAAQPWEIDGRSVRLRDDTSGALNAWDDLWAGAVLRPVVGSKDKRSEPRHSMARITARLKTVPNIAHPVLLLEGNATRISPTLRGVSSVLVEQKTAAAPLVRLSLDGRIARHVNRPAAQTLAALSVDRAVLDLQDFAINAAEPGRVRGIVPKSWRFAIGRGVGMHFHRALHRHVHEVFPEIQPIGTRAVKGRFPAPRQGRIETGAIAAALRTHGHASLTVVCLWARDVNRRRMLTELGAAFGVDLLYEDPADGAVVSVSDQIRVAVKHAPELLDHGLTVDRVALAKQIPVLHPATGDLTVVLCETDSNHGARVELEDSEAESEQEARAAYKRFLDRRRSLEAEDAKPQVRRLLARLQLVSQFLDQPKQQRKRAKPPKHEDYPARAAVIDLLRSAGMTDDRFTHALAGVRIGEHLASNVAHIGIHIRQQNKQTRGGKTKLVVTITALLPPSGGETVWKTLAWAHRDRPQWEPYPLACAHFHAVALERGSRSHDELVRLAGIVEHALGTLTDSRLRGIPYAVYVDGFTSRGVWPGLFNNRQGAPPDLDRPWLPGATLPAAQRPIATVRVNAEPSETPRPVSVTAVRLEAEGRQIRSESRTTTRLFRVETDFGDPVFWLSRVPVQFDGAGSGRLGEFTTRWGVEDGPATRRTWYSMNTLEIYPIGRLPDTSMEALAVSAARLCRQTSGWDGQTTYPEPLHLARQLDLDHPEYRADELPDDPESPLLAHDE